MRKQQMWNRLTAMLLCLVMGMSAAVPITGLAETHQTLYGAEETVVYSGQSDQKRSTDFNSDWKFRLGNLSNAQNQNFDDSGWERVSLPHDFSIIQNFTTSSEAESGFLPGGVGWYRKSFTLPQSCAGKSIVLNFDGVYMDAYVYVNGRYVGEHHYGYTAFAFDISDYVTCDGITQNVIAVRAVNNIPSSRWYSGSGIYRDVTLIVTDSTHVAHNGVYVTTPNLESQQNSGVSVSILTDIQNDAPASDTVTLRNTVYNAAGEAVSDTAESTITLNSDQMSSEAQTVTVNAPSLWSIDSPTLYYVRTEIIRGGETIDTLDTEFGFRYFSFSTTDGFRLNGQKMKLNGVCMHHDQGALGSAAYSDAIYRQLTIMKDMGVNAIRVSHNPADEDFIRICNEIGLLVIEEAFDTWLLPKNSNNNDYSKYFSVAITSTNEILGGSSDMTWAEYDIKSMVDRDKNAPSVILWSLGNEILEGLSGDTSSYPTIAGNLIGWVKEIDQTRPTTFGDNKLRDNNATAIRIAEVIHNNGGVIGLNYCGYGQNDTQHNNHPSWRLYGSETSSAINSRSVYTAYSNENVGLQRPSYDTSYVSWGMTAHDSLYNTLTRDYIAGEFVWTGFDYIGEPTPWNGTWSGSISGSGAIPNSSYFGIVDTAGFEKDTYYLYRSQWNASDTTLHLVTAWDSENMYTSGGKTPVVIYSNAPVVKLYRDGEHIATATRNVNTTPAGHQYYTYSTQSHNNGVCSAVNGSGSTALYATFNVSYKSGTISAVAYQSDGQTVIDNTRGTASVSTPGAVSKLDIRVDKTQIAADGSSLAYIEVSVEDAAGNLDTTAANIINFNLTGNGRIMGVDNGNAATIDKFQQPSVLTSSTSAQIAAFGGKALVIVSSTKDAGEFNVSVTSSGLTGGDVHVVTNPVGEQVVEGLVNYTMVRDYSVMEGTAPALLTQASGVMADGSAVTGQIEWQPVAQDVYSTAGDYVINGVLSIAGLEIPVNARLHVIAQVVAVLNYSAATSVGAAPTLPDVMPGVRENGALAGEFSVDWAPVNADMFAQPGDVITVSGEATIFGETKLPLTASIRVGESAITESVNVAGQYLTLTEDCTYTSDNLYSIVNGVTNNGNSTNERWTNYNNRNTSPTASITFTWATAQLLSGVNLYLFADDYSAALPANVEFAYSLDGTSFTPIGYSATDMVNYTSGATEYTFDNVINPVALRITLTQQSGHCVGLTEVEIMTYAAELISHSSAKLSGITVNGLEVPGFAGDSLSYTVTVGDPQTSLVAAVSNENAAITVLPIFEDVVRIITVAEDKSESRTYEVTLVHGAPTPVNTGALEEAVANAQPYLSGRYTAGSLAALEAALANAQAVLDSLNTTQTHVDEAVAQINSAIEALVDIGVLEDALANAQTHMGGSYTAGSLTSLSLAITNAQTVLSNPNAVSMQVSGAIITLNGAINALVNIGALETAIADAEAALADTEIYTVGSVERLRLAYEHALRVLANDYATQTDVNAAASSVITAINSLTVIPSNQQSAPKAGIGAIKVDDKRIMLIGQFIDYENADQYYEVEEHGLLYIYTNLLGTKPFTINTMGRTRIRFGGYNSDGTFSYTMKPKTQTLSYSVRSYLAYINDQGRLEYVYSNIIRVSLNTFPTV